MPLLDTLPEEVENSLRDLRDLREKTSSTSNGHALPGAATTAEPSLVNVVASDPVPMRNGADAEEDSALDAAAEIADPKTGLEEGQHLAFETDINVRGKFGTEWLVADSSHLYV